VAIQRGPLVYCVEGTDNGGHAWNLVVPDNTTFDTASLHIADERVTTVTADIPVLTVAPDGQSARTEIRRMTAIPYYTWANRGKTEMQVWLPTTIREIKINY
jgi:DUF1680 family protein